jgi:carboxymethylenebutenolidase
MDTTISLTSADGNAIGGYLATPDGPAKGAVVVVQEIFGVNSHIRSVADRLAADGFVALAPQYFDRLSADIQLGYEGSDLQTGIGHVTALGMDNPLADTAAAIAHLHAAGHPKVGITGFCWGGTMTWASACRLDGLSAAVGYYGGGIHGLRNETPKVPTMLHFGDKDVYIPADQLADIKAAHPDLPLYTYPANHGFHCDARADYDAPSAATAYARTIEFFARHLS